MAGDEGAGDGGGGGQHGSPLLMSRAFVVQFTRDTIPADHRFSGRVEHIESGRSKRFASLDELLAFLAGLLEEA